MRLASAARRGLARCHACGQLARHGASVDEPADCLRCGAALHLRKPDSIGRTWAFIVAAAVMYLPANALPIMVTASLFGEQSDTILSGIAYLWHHGSWHLAIIVFVASVVVPLLKLIALTILVLAVQFRTSWDAHQLTRLYRLVEVVGKWSMLDIFVVALMAALVHLRALATIEAGPGAVAFCAVVVLTLFAAESFDPRLIWDNREAREEREELQNG